MTTPTNKPGYTGDLPPQAFNMAAYVIGRAARATPEKIALLVYADAEAAEPGETWTYRDVETATLRIAAGLRDRGLAPGDRLLIRLDNTSAYALVFFGAIAAGLVPLATSTHLSEDEAAFLAADSGARAVALADHLPRPLAAGIDIITAEDVARMLREVEPSGGYAATRADDPAYMVYTSDRKSTRLNSSHT